MMEEEPRILRRERDIDLRPAHEDMRHIVHHGGIELDECGKAIGVCEKLAILPFVGYALMLYQMLDRLSSRHPYI